MPNEVCHRRDDVHAPMVAPGERGTARDVGERGDVGLAASLGRLRCDVLGHLHDVPREPGGTADQLLGHPERRVDDLLTRPVLRVTSGKTPFTVSRNFRTDSNAVFPASWNDAIRRSVLPGRASVVDMSTSVSLPSIRQHLASGIVITRTEAEVEAFDSFSPDRRIPEHRVGDPLRNGSGGPPRSDRVHGLSLFR